MSIITPNRSQTSGPLLEARRLGQILYNRAYDLQRYLHAQRLADRIPDQLLLLDHPPTVTLPRRNQSENLLLSENELSERGIDSFPTDRGGQVTLHNPGQLVGYLICRLEPGKRDLHSFLRWIEVCLGEVVSQFSLDGQSRKGLTGLWIENRKIASIGIAVKKWVTLHGFALNVNNDLSQFGVMHPCGLVDVEMTSMSRELGEPIDWRKLTDVAADCFGATSATHSLGDEALSLIETGIESYDRRDGGV